MWQNLKTWILTKLRKIKKIVTTQILKFWQNSKTQIVTKKIKVWQLKNLNCVSSNSDSSDSTSRDSSNSYIFYQKQMDTSTTHEIFSGQLFAILAMFKGNHHKTAWSLANSTFLQASVADTTCEVLIKLVTQLGMNIELGNYLNSAFYESLPSPIVIKPTMIYFFNLTLKLLRDRSKFKIRYGFPFLSKP